MENNTPPTPANVEKAVAGVSFKSLSITMGDDGKPKILINGEEIPNMTSVYFSFYNEPYYKSVSFDYCTTEKGATGEMTQSSRFSYCPPQNGCAAVIRPNEEANSGASAHESASTKAGVAAFSQI